MAIFIDIKIWREKGELRRVRISIYIYIYIYIGVEKVEVASLISILLNLLQKLKVMTYKGRLKI